ncbi:M56 family metallopeptidase [Candidatus Formimonas warabiya]|uniref:M56 family metallopeptidase n=1 Tax=Formimonas warabiya TaxID=1761012 RepID=UPI0011D16DA6|nr:M56 family metallopeptidase [Candidatus Formimonas warabiya]
MAEIFQAVFAASLSATVVGLVLLILKGVLKNRVNPKWHYLLWIVLVLKLLVPYGPESAVSLFNMMPSVTQDTDFTPSDPESSQAIMNTDQEMPQIPSAYAVQDTSPAIVPVVEKMVPYLWFLGAMLFLIWLVYTNYSLHRKLIMRGTPAPEAVNLLVRECKKKMGVEQNIEIVMQDLVSTPALLGVMKPKILLSPANLPIGDKALSYILLHELAHFKRKDLPVNYLLLVLQVMHWFNPVIWYCFKRIREDMEVAADEMVLDVLDREEQKAYGKALLSVLENFHPPRLVPKLIGMVDDRKNIERRIRMIKMADFFQSKRRMAICTGILCIVILCGVTFTNALAKQASCAIGDYTLKVPGDWKVTGNQGELIFAKDNISFGGVQIVDYTPDQPLSLPNHSETKSKKDLDGLITKAVLVNLELTQPADAEDMDRKNENHLYLIFTDQNMAYDIYADTKFVPVSQLVKIGKSFMPAKEEEGIKAYQADVLWKLKTAYVGNNSKVVNLIDHLPYADLRREVSLKTDYKPYGITVKYDFAPSGLRIGTIEGVLRNNAVVLLALIDNVDDINFQVSFSGEERKYHYTRIQLEQGFQQDLRAYAKDVKTWETFLNSLALRLLVYPENYTMAMSSTPGIRILAQYDGSADRVQYSATYGQLLTWDSTTGKIAERGQKVEFPYDGLDRPVYWTPGFDNASLKAPDKISVKTAIFHGDRVLAEKQVHIVQEPSMFYRVEASPDLVLDLAAPFQSQKAETIDEAVSSAVKGQKDHYAEGEVATEGHIILDVEEKEGLVTVYTLASFSWFGFEDGIFTSISGSGSIPTVISFSKNERGNYHLVQYKEPMDGAGYSESVKEMFPKQLWDQVFNNNQYPTLARQQEDQAKLYLDSIGRKAQVSSAVVEKKPARINVEASNKLFAELTKWDSELNKFPYWLGTKEILENGVRYLYETSQSKTGDGFDLISFKKTKEDGTVVKEYRYKIVGSEPQLIHGDQ